MTEYKFVESILTPFLNRCNTLHNRLAFVLGNKEYTYSDLACCIAEHMAAFNRVEAPYIGVYVDEQFESYAAIWAVWFCGKTAVPIIRNISNEREHLVRADCTPIEVFRPHTYTPSVDYTDAINALMDRLAQLPNDSAEAILLYTSGSTGVPKGAPLSGKNIAAFYAAFQKTCFDWNETDRCLQMFDLSFDFSMLVYLPTWLGGGCIYGIPTGEILATYIYYLLTEKELTVLPIVPTLLNYLKPYFSELDCPHLRQLMVSGEPLPVSLVEAWYREVPYGVISNPYGPTECCMLSTQIEIPRNSPLLKEMGEYCSLGYVFDGMTAYVLNENGVPSQLNEPGELYLSGPQVSSGYINRPELNMERYVMLDYEGTMMRFYRTGDWVIPRADGRYDFIGRMDNQVKLKGGFRVELGEIESMVQRIVPGCNNRAVVVKNKVSNNEVVIVFESNPFELDAIIAKIKEALPWYMHPLGYYFYPEFPLNQNKKTNRSALTAWAQQQFEQL